MQYIGYIPVVALALLIVVSFLILKPILLAVFVGALLAYIFYPLYEKVLQKIKKPTIAALLVSIFVFLIILIPGVFFFKTIVQEAYVLFLVGKERLAVGLFQNCTNKFCQMIKDVSQDPILNAQVQQMLKSVTNWVVQKASNILISLPKMFLNLFIALFSFFYLLRDGEKIMLQINEFIFMGEKKYAFIILRLREIIHGLVYGHIIIALLQGALGAFGFFVVGIPSPIIWGIIMAVLALIPSLGTGLIWFPAALIIFLDGVFQNSDFLIFKGIALFLYSFFIVAGIEHLLKPKLISGKAKVHPLVILIGVFGGIFLFGPLGVIVGPLILALTSVFIEAYLVKKL